MGLTALLFKTQVVALALALQGEPAPELTDAEATTIGAIFICLGIIVVAAGVWMTIDAWINYGPGWGAGAGAGCLFTSALGCGVGGCLVIIPYLILRFAAMPPQAYRERQENRAPSPPPFPTPPGGSSQPASEYPHYVQQVLPDIEIAALEHDERIDDMLAQGKAREAMDYAQQMYKMAQDFKDVSGQARYAKYIERIRRGIK
jgi:hypothetical protein